MRLSLIVPTLNEESRLPATLDRLRQECAAGALEVAIVDGGSDDGSRELLRTQELPWIASERGRARQMNAGAAATGGDTLLFLHADTTLPDGWRGDLEGAIEEGHVGGFFRLQLDSERWLLRAVGRLITMRSRWTGVATGDQAIFITRAAFDELGGFAPLPLFEDVDLMARLRRLGPVAPLNRHVVTSARRWERCGPFRTILRMWLLRLLYSLGWRPERLQRFYGDVR